MQQERSDLELGEPGSPDAEEEPVEVPVETDELGQTKRTIVAESRTAAQQWDDRLWNRA